MWYSKKQNLLLNGQSEFAWQPSLIKHASENDVIILFKSNKNRN